MAHPTPSPSTLSSNLTPTVELTLDDYDPKPDDDLICPICLSVLREPVECHCRHIFCRQCIARWVSTDNTCPVCRRRDIGVFSHVRPRFLNRLNKLKVKCRNTGCPARVSADSYASHARMCEFREVGTGDAERQLRTSREAADTEAKPRGLVVCEKGCGLIFTPERLQSHCCLEELRRKLNETVMEREELIRQLEASTEVLEKNCKLLRRLQVFLRRSTSTIL